MPFKLPTNLHPPKNVCVTLEIPDDPGYIDAFLGAFLLTTQWRNWQLDPTHSGTIAAGIMRAIFAELVWDQCGNPNPPTPNNPILDGEDDTMAWRQNPDDPCWIQEWCCGEWQNRIHLSDCTGSVLNPPPGLKPPQGQCSDFTGVFTASQRLLLPFVVNSGDVLSVIQASGAGSPDGISWYCVDGEVFFAGACTGGGGTHSGDPLSSLNTMRLLWVIGSSYYDAMAGAFTVPGGVTNAQVYMQVNRSSLAGLQGNYKVQLQMCNNTSSTQPGSRTFDFTSSDGGFVDAKFNGVGSAVYSAGNGWSCGNPADQVLANFTKLIVSTSHIAEIDVEYINVAADPVVDAWPYQQPIPGTNGTSYTEFHSSMIADGTVHTVQVTGLNIGLTPGNYFGLLFRMASTSAPVGDLYVRKLKIYWNDHDPFS